MSALVAFGAACGARNELMTAGGDGDAGTAPGAGAAAEVGWDTTPGTDGNSDVITPRSCPPGVTCDDGVDCTVDLCSERLGRCTHTPLHQRCPSGHYCHVEHGCQADVLAHSGQVLYRVAVPAVLVSQIGLVHGSGWVTGQQISDAARMPGGTLVIDDFYRVLLLDDLGEVVETLPAHGMFINALGASADGSLYGAGGDVIYRLDLPTGQAEPVTTLPNGYSSSGDLVVMGDRLLLAASHPASTNVLLAIDLASGSVTVLGELGVSCVYGLVAIDSLLYGFSCNGAVLSIDPATAASAVLAETGIGFWGAAPWQ